MLQLGSSRNLLGLVAGVLVIFIASSSAIVFAAAPDLQVQGWQNIKARNFTKALDCFNAALKEHPDSWMLRQNIGNCQMELGHYDAAITQLTRSIEMGGLHASQCVNLAAVYQRSGQPKQALNWLSLAC